MRQGQLVDVQRARILSALVEECCERGGANVSVAHVVERSGVSRRTFYETFDGLDDCFLAAFERALALATERVEGACDPAADWLERTRAGLIALLCFLDEQRRLGRVLVVESQACGPAILARRGRILDKLVVLVEQGREHPKALDGESLPALTGEAIVGAVLSVLQSRLGDPRERPVLPLAGELMSTIVLPYLGAGAARRELRRPVPTLPALDRESEPLLSDPFKDAGTRLTYRTVRVLVAAAEHPGASNRLIAKAAEIADQGQVSKLLGRLERIGMLANTGVGPERGGPNAWSLTEVGQQVIHSLHAHTEQNGNVARTEQQRGRNATH